MSRVYDVASGALRALYDARVSNPPVLDLAERFPDGYRFADAWTALRDEAVALTRRMHAVPRFHELMAEQRAISDNDGHDWRMYLLKVYGNDVEEHMAACPYLGELVRTSPDVLSATLSFLAPHKHIPRHRGPFKGVLRFQLGLSVPMRDDGRPAAVLRLADRDYLIGNGDAMLWDDTYPHEVWNASDEWRIALLLDVRRHDLPADMALLSRALIAGVGMVARWKLPGLAGRGGND
jgi:aspartate beta-hydroxylase